MKKTFAILILSIFFSIKAYAGKSDMISALKGIPGVGDASWAQDISLWVVMTNPKGGHDFDQLGSMICNGGVSNFGVKKMFNNTDAVELTNLQENLLRTSKYLTHPIFNKYHSET